MSYRNKEQTVDLVAFLNELGDKANKKFPSLNWGGCCVFAGLVATELEKRGYPVQGRVASGEAGKPRSQSITDVRKKVTANTSNQWNQHGIYFGHIGIEFYDGVNVFMYDSNGCVSPEELLDGMHSFEGRLTVQELTELWQDNGPTRGYSISWNTTFDRNNIPDLEKLIKSHFKRVPAVS